MSTPYYTPYDFSWYNEFLEFNDLHSSSKSIIKDFDLSCARKLKFS